MRALSLHGVHLSLDLRRGSFFIIGLKVLGLCGFETEENELVIFAFLRSKSEKESEVR